MRDATAGLHAGLLLLCAVLCLRVQAPDACASAAVPGDYSACGADAAHSRRSELLCRYTVPEDQSNTRPSQDYLACQMAKPDHRYLLGYRCRYIANPGNDTVPRLIRCTKPGRPPLFPGFSGDCRFIFYNRDYIFPTSHAQCLAREDHDVSMRYDGRRLCMIVVSYYPASPWDYYDAGEAEFMMNACTKAGGHTELVAGQYPACTLSFTEYIAN